MHTVNAIRELRDMLTFMRPCGSPAERLFIQRYVQSIPGATCDSFGNWHVVIGTAPILWSSHTDTVHRESGRQTIAYDDATGVITLSKRSKRGRSNCLGADCTVGVWIMRHMITAGVQGRYVFHFGEERGGIGSGNMAHYTPALLTQYQMAIAFDRRGTQSVITYQAGGRCASDAFALSLAAEIGRVSALTLAPDPTGVFTDTALYTDLVPECSNVSVGYYAEHSRDERLDSRHALALLNAMCAIDLGALVVERDPMVEREIERLRAEQRSSAYLALVTDGAERVSTGDASGYLGGDPVVCMCQECGADLLQSDIDHGDCFTCGAATVPEEETDDHQGVYLDPDYPAILRTLAAELTHRHGRKH